MLAVLAAAVLVGDTAVERSVAAQSSRGSSLTAVPGAVGFLDPTGPYEVVPGWPKDLSTLPGNEKWTFGAGQGVFAESPDRVYYIQRGQLPVLPQAGGRRGNPLPQIGPNLIFPVAGMWRNATQASPPGALEVNGKVGDDSDAGKAGVDFLWENCIVVINRNGDIIETWKQWDKMLRRPHSVYISPYDPQKNVYIVDDYRHAIFKFTNDGKTLLKTIGEPNVHASDDKHFYRPTFMAFQADGSYYVADGYANTRVVKFDKNDNYVTAWGERGEAGKETRPNYFNNVHGVGVDPGTRQVYVNDRGNRRIQVFDENGKFIRMWSMQPGRQASTCISCTSTPTGACGSSTRSPSSSRSSIARDISSTRGAGWAHGRARSSACTASAWTRNRTCISRRWGAAACRSSVRGKARIRRTWLASTSTLRGSSVCPSGLLMELRAHEHLFRQRLPGQAQVEADQRGSHGQGTLQGKRQEARHAFDDTPAVRLQEITQAHV